MRVLILCTGNSCRSQMAHGFLQSISNKIDVHSAGTKPATQVNPIAIEVMKEAGIDISAHTPKNVSNYLNQEWDYVITVCGGANESCPAFTGKVKHRIHIGFEDPSEAIGTPEFIKEEFRRVRNEIKNRIPAVLLHQHRTTHSPLLWQFQSVPHRTRLRCKICGKAALGKSVMLCPQPKEPHKGE